MTIWPLASSFLCHVLWTDGRYTLARISDNLLILAIKLNPPRNQSSYIMIIKPRISLYAVSGQSWIQHVENPLCAYFLGDQATLGI